MKITEKKRSLCIKEIARAAILLALFMGTVAQTSAAGAVSFSDVSEQTAYYNDICWAAEQGIVTGDNGNFKPEQKVTVQQFFTMLSRAIPERQEAQDAAFDAPKGSMLYHLRRAIHQGWTDSIGTLVELSKDSALNAGCAWNAALMAAGTQVYSGALLGEAANPSTDGMRAAKALNLAGKDADASKRLTRAEAVHLIRAAVENTKVLPEPDIVKEMKNAVQNVQQNDVNSVYADLMRIPEPIRKAFRQDGWIIRFDPDAVQAYSEKSGITNINGMTEYQDKTIYLANVKSLLHELGHYYQEKLKSSGMDQNVYAAFDTIRQKETASAAIYETGNQQDGKEFFADAFRFYVLYGRTQAELSSKESSGSSESQRYFDHLKETGWVK